MKILLVLSFILGGFIHSNGQEINEIKTYLDENGNLIGESIIVFKDKTATQIYNYSLEWVSYTFRNTESVMQSKVENKMIRINGLSKSTLGPYMGYYLDISYIIQLDIKDGKLKFKVSDLTQIAQSYPFTRMLIEPLLYKKNRELKSNKRYQEAKNQIDLELSRLLSSLKMTIEEQSKNKESEW